MICFIALCLILACRAYKILQQFRKKEMLWNTFINNSIQHTQLLFPALIQCNPLSYVHPKGETYCFCFSSSVIFLLLLLFFFFFPLPMLHDNSKTACHRALKFFETLDVVVTVCCIVLWTPPALCSLYSAQNAQFYNIPAVDLWSDVELWSD